MQRLLLSILCILTSYSLGFLPQSVHAASLEDTASNKLENITAVIAGPADVQVGRTIVLDATVRTLPGEQVKYRWYIEPGQLLSSEVQAVFTPEKSGTVNFRLLVKITGLDGKVRTEEARQSVIVYKRKIAVITDGRVSEEKLLAHTKAAMDEGVYLSIFRTEEAGGTIAFDTELRRALTQFRSPLENAESVVIWTEPLQTLQSILSSLEGNAERTAAMQNQTIVVISEQNLSTLSRTLRGTVRELSPRTLIISRKEAFTPLITSKDAEEFLTTLTTRDIDARSIIPSQATVRPWEILSYLVDFMLTHGVASQTVILLLVLPIIATILTFLKQVIGLTTFGLYTPSIVSLSFLALGWWVGIISLLFIVIVGYIARMLLRRWRLLYIPKVAIIITIVSIALLVLLGFGAIFGKVTITRDTVFILLIMSTLAENFINLKTEEGWSSAIFGITETLFGSALCVIIVQASSFQAFILAYPEIILLSLVINAYLGKWTGLRLIEYFRFREVFRHLQEE